jgi:hypothetical protein
MTARNGAGRANGVPSGLTDELVDVLAVVDEAPPGLAEATIALLPYGSRTSLAVHGVIERMDGGSGEAVAIRITTEGRAVIAACARARRQGPKVGVRPQSQFVARLREYVQALQRQNPTPNLNGLSARIHREL